MRAHWTWTVLLVVLFVATLGLTGCQQPIDRGPTPPGPIVGAEEAPPVDPAIDAWFRSTRAANADLLVPGDLIGIRIQEHDELNIARLVPPDGQIPLHKAGRAHVNALHKTPLQLEQDIKDAYDTRYPGLYVTVTIEQAAARYVYVAGAVGTNGRQGIDTGERLDVLKAISQAGGPSAGADLSRVTIRRMHPDIGDVVTSPQLDIKRVLEIGDHADNLVLLPGDQLVIPESKFQVSVLGHVTNPGAVQWHKGLTLSAAVADRGGFKRFAKTTGIQVRRSSGETVDVDFELILEGTEADLVLYPRDVVFIPEKWL